jgi:hypothetical protein
VSFEVVAEVAASHLGLAALHHLAIAVLIAILWIRRESMERPVAIYFTAAFGTACAALAGRPETRVFAAMSGVLCAMWLREAVRAVGSMKLRRTPRLRLAVMAVLFLFAFLYPGHSGVMPVFLFSSLGVTLAPTLIAALATLNAAAPSTNRPLHWSVAAAGAAVGVSGLLSEGIVHIPLLVATGYAVPLLVGKARTVEERSALSDTSVRAVADRIHERRVLFSKARRTSVRRLRVRKRK